MATIEELNVGDVVVADKPVHPTFVYADTRIKPKQIGLLVEKNPNGGSVIVKDGSRRYVAGGSTFRRTKKTTREKFFQEIKADNIGFIKSYGNKGGCDPEVFAVDEHGVIVPAFEYLPHKEKAKKEPCNEGDGKGWTQVFYDGFQAEFCTAPNGCHAWLVDYIWSGLKRIRTALKKHNPKASLTHRTVLDVPRELMAKAPRDGVDMGCSPSSNAYGTASPVLGKIAPEEIPFRFAGVHYHAGYTASPEENIDRVKAMDAFVGVASVAALRGLEDARRRQFYGLAGEYRTPPHGIEYRVLSSAILVHPAVTHLFFDMCRTADLAGKDKLRIFHSATDEQVVQCINNYDVDLALKIIGENKSVYRAMLRRTYDYFGNCNSVVDNAMSLIMDGVFNVIPTESLEANWFLKGEYVRDNSKGDWKSHSEGKNCSMHTLTLE